MNKAILSEQTTVQTLLLVVVGLIFLYIHDHSKNISSEKNKIKNKKSYHIIMVLSPQASHSHSKGQQYKTNKTENVMRDRENTEYGNFI